MAARAIGRNLLLPFDGKPSEASSIFFRPKNGGHDELEDMSRRPDCPIQRFTRIIGEWGFLRFFEKYKVGI